MWDFITGLLPGGGLTGIIAAVVAGIAALGALLLGARKAGKDAERVKQAEKKIEALEDRLEMDREATAAERRSAGMTDEEARAEALRWSKR